VQRVNGLRAKAPSGRSNGQPRSRSRRIVSGLEYLIVPLARAV
jgi:hypothetical protein